MNTYVFLSVLFPVLMIAAPIFLVLWLDVRGLLYGALIFWFLGISWNQVAWSLTGRWDGVWLILGLPAGILYSAVIYGLKAVILWVLSITGLRYRRLSVRLWQAVVVAVVVSALIWQCRPYGMGISEMIGGLSQGPKDIVAFEWNEPYYFHNQGRIDLKTGLWNIGGSDESDEGSVTLTCGGATHFQTQLSVEQIAKVRQLIVALPIRRKLFFERYNFDRYVYLAFWRGGQFQVFKYNRRDLPQDVVQFFALLGPDVLKVVRGEE